MIPQNYLWLTAGVAGVTAVWQQIRSFFGRFVSYFWVNISIDDQAANALMPYVYSNLKLSPFGQNHYMSEFKFIRPKERHGMVIFRSIGKSMTFYDRRFLPFLITFNIDANKELGKISISYFRGTYNIEQILIDAAEFFNSRSDKIYSAKGAGRYLIRRIVGSRFKKQRENNNEPKALASMDSHQSLTMVPLGWKPEDLLAPTNASPFSSLFYPKEIQDFIQQVRQWYRSERWYKERGISWRFGGLFYGPPGTGKTSCARAIAQELGIPIIIIDLTTMDNNDLIEAWADIASCAPCIVLLEDLDRVYDGHPEDPNFHQGFPSLDCLLNCISGVQPADGILVLASANDVTKLDPALGVPDANGKSTRPGRLDVCVYFGEVTEEARNSIALRILPTINHDQTITYVPQNYIRDLVVAGGGETGAQFTKRVADKALELYWAKK